MCELLIISSQYPAHMGFSLSRLANHSQYLDNDNFSNPDGWGAAYFEGKDVALLREPQSANKSELIQFIEMYISPTNLLISHIRKATQGNKSLSNTQPFTRELTGRMHVFAHNGNLPDICKLPEFSLQHYHPIGDTGSEYAFCYLLDKLKPLWQDYHINHQIPPIQQRYDLISAYAKKLRKYGPVNFIYSDSNVSFAHAHKRIQDDGKLKPPSLYMLNRYCDKSKTQTKIKKTPSIYINNIHEKQELLIVASVPLTDEKWQAMKEGEVIVFAKEKKY